MTGARHVEVQLIADSHGTAWALGVRDCSIQRRNQKVIEESSSPLLSDEQADELKASAERLALAVGYVGAGTVEFLYHPGEQTFAFLEVNTRLQVEHSITEATTGIDLVKAQIHGRAGRPPRGREAGRDRARDRGPAQRRGPRPRLRAVARPHRAPRPAVRPGHPGRHRRRRGRHHPARLRLDDRQDHRLRPHPRRGAGPAAPRDDLDHRGDRGRRLQQELRAGPAGPARGRRRAPPVWADTGWIDRVRAEGRLVAHAHAGIAVVAAAIEAYLDGCGSRPRGSSRPPTAAGRPPRTRSASRSSSSCAACPTRSPRSTPAPAASG